MSAPAREPAPGAPAGQPPLASPLQRSEAGAFGLLGGLLALLALILLVAAALVFTIDEAPHPVPRGFLLLGLAAACGGGAWALVRLARRPVAVRVAPPWSASRPPPPEGWRRERLGAAWTDALVPLVPVVLVSPVLWAREVLDLDALIGFALLVGLLEALVLPLLVLERRQVVRLALVPGGVRVERRNGGVTLLDREGIAAVRLDATSAQGMTWGTLTLVPVRGEPITFREPMSAPLPEIAWTCAAHLQRPLVGDTSAWGAPAGA